jgi:hypothetical protein
MTRANNNTQTPRRRVSYLKSKLDGCRLGARSPPCIGTVKPDIEKAARTEDY